MLRAYFLGEMRFCNDGREIANLASRKCGELLAYLLLNAGHRYSRDHLADAIWGEAPPADAAKAVRQELWAARTALNDTGLDADALLATDGNDVWFHKDAGFWLDAFEFEAAAAAVLEAPKPAARTVEALAAAVDLYRGDLLPGNYADWCLYPREALRDRQITALEYLMYVHEADQDWDAAIRYGKRLLNVDHLLEYVHRALMRCYYAKGNRARALKQFATCRRILAREFSEPTEPMTETVALHEQIKRQAFAGKAPPLPEPPAVLSKRLRAEVPPAGRDGALGELAAAKDSLSAARQRIDQVMRSLRRG